MEMPFQHIGFVLKFFHHLWQFAPIYSVVEKK
jgi:hypothetical protein